MLTDARRGHGRSEGGEQSRRRLAVDEHDDRRFWLGAELEPRRKGGGPIFVRGDKTQIEDEGFSGRSGNGGQIGRQGMDPMVSEVSIQGLVGGRGATREGGHREKRQ